MDSISIKGYKSFRDFKLELRPINVLIGANGAGKSNFLSFFEFLNRLYDQKLKEYVIMNGGNAMYFHKGKTTMDTISAEISFGKDEYLFSIINGVSRFVFREEALWINNREQFVPIPSQPHEAEIKPYLRINKDIKDYFFDIKKYHFHDTGRRSPFVQESSVKTDIYYLYERGENLAAFLYNIREEHPIQYNFIVKTIQRVAPYFSDFYFIISPTDTVRLMWHDVYSSEINDPIEFSDGTIRFIALAALFLQPNPPSMIIIDEPELGLHPQAIHYLAAMVQSVAQKGTQVILATQSADLMSLFNPEDIITVDQVDGATEMKRLSTEELAMWLNDYSLGDLWKQNIIRGGQPR